MKKLAIQIPLIHLLSMVMLFMAVDSKIEQQSQGKSEVFEFIYSIAFFLSNDYATLALGTLLLLPFPLFILSIFKKRKNLVRGFFFQL